MRSPGESHPELPEEPLLGGRITPGVVRVGETVRRPTGPHSPFAHALLRHLERVGFAGAPRFLGIDEMGREILTYIEGDVPDNISPSFTDRQLVEAAELLRRYHDATARSVLAGDEEVVCHNDVSPDNTVLVEGRPTAMIDFDMAAPGPRIRDLSLGAFLWLDMGWDGREPEEQRRANRTNTAKMRRPRVTGLIFTPLGRTLEHFVRLPVGCTDKKTPLPRVWHVCTRGGAPTNMQTCPPLPPLTAGG